MSLVITSKAFAPNGAIPPLYTCEGKDLSPPLAFGGVPPGAKSSPSSSTTRMRPVPPRRDDLVHWVLYNMPAVTPCLSEATKSSALPADTGEGHWKAAGPAILPRF